MTQEDQEIYTHSVECPSCFINWIYHDESWCVPKEMMCEYCQNHPLMRSKDLLIRRVHVLNSAKMLRFPEIMIHLFKHIELKD